MPLTISADTTDAIALEELVDVVATAPLTGQDDEALASLGPSLKKLANNRSFLADIMIAELKARCEAQVRSNQYSAQVILLHLQREFFLRANLWPAMTDSIVRQSGTDPFFYGVPHDHNFSFLTVGYFGPGYWSDYYEYEYQNVAGYIGEEVPLRFVERSRLEEGKVMLYRAHRDIHLQLPADALSVSLNIVETSGSAPFREQYKFDLEKGVITGLANGLSLEPLLAITGQLGGGNGADLLDHFAARHPSDRVRWLALKAKTSQAEGVDGRIAVLEEGTRSDRRFVAEMAAREVDVLQRGRDWIENGPRIVRVPFATAAE